MASALFAGSLGITSAAAQADTSPAPNTPATVSADVLPTWQTNGVVWASITVGNTVYVTGDFSTARPPGVTEGGAGQISAVDLFAFDITTGERIMSFSHSLNAQGLALAVSPDHTRLYVGGDFTTVDGIARNRVAAFDVGTGALVQGWQPRPYSQVAAIAATNSTVYLGGSFTSLGGVARTRLAAVNASDGGLTPWAPTADDRAVKSMVLSPDASRLIVGGQFTTLNRVPAYGMGSLSTSTGATLVWAANTKIKSGGPNGAVNTLSTDGRLVYGGAYAFGSGATFEGTFAADPNTGTILWLNDCHGDTYGTFATGQTVYAVSHAHDCSAIGNFPDVQPRVAHRALAYTTYATGTNSGPDTYGWNYRGEPDSTLLHWYPTLKAGTYTGQTQAAWTVTGNSQYIVLAGEFPSVNGLAQSGLARFAISSIAPDKTGPQYSVAQTPTVSAIGGGQVKVSWTSTWDMDNQNLVYQVRRDGSTTTPVYTTTGTSNFWQLPAQTFTDTGLTPGSTHTYYVTAVDLYNNSKISGKSSVITVT